MTVGRALPEWDPAIDLEWGDGEYRFRIGFGELVVLETKFDAGFLVLYRALNVATCRSSLVREVIRLGLEGGGMSPDRVRPLIARYFDARPPTESVSTAMLVLERAIFLPQDAAGKGAGGGAQAEPMSGSPSP